MQIQYNTKEMIYKKTKYKYDIAQKDKIQLKQNTNATKLKKTKYKCVKT